jgi:ATP-binding cassette subfamily F protein 3
VRIGYFDQKLEDLDENNSLIDEIHTVRGDWNQDVVRAYLGRFSISGDDAFKKVKGLSGGERNRLQMAKLMLRPYNLLAMDEPTNHLDIAARETLEEALTEFDGSLVVVSHDRYFLDRVATKILHLDPLTGRVDAHIGNYSDWKQRISEPPPVVVDAKPGRSQPKPSPKAPESPPRPVAATAREVAASDAADKDKRLAEQKLRKDRDRDLSRKQRRFGQIEQEIERCEAELKRLREQLTAEHGGEWQRLHQLVSDEQSADAKLQALLAEWEQLGSELSTTSPPA